LFEAEKVAETRPQKSKTASWAHKPKYTQKLERNSITHRLVPCRELFFLEPH